MAKFSNRGKRQSAAEIRRYLLELVQAGEPRLVARAAGHLGMTPQAINAHLRQLTRQGQLTAIGATKGRRYELVWHEWSQVFQIANAAEDRVWRSFVLPHITPLPDNVLRICEYGFTEMCNNAIEHSGGTTMTVAIRSTAAVRQIIVFDDGVGIFRKIKDHLGLDDERQAVLELTKGKLTTDPDHHSGEGIFFTSRSFDGFSILSHELMFHHFPDQSDWSIETDKDASGTTVFMDIAANSNRSLKAVFDKFASGGTDYRFSITHVPAKLSRLGAENLVSRSQARRLLARLDRFEQVVLDFTGVPVIGQAFADEIFRVFAHSHPGVRLGWVNANSEVEQLINRARATS